MSSHCKIFNIVKSLSLKAGLNTNINHSYAKVKILSASFRYSTFDRFEGRNNHMEQFWVTGLIVLAFSSWTSSKEEYIMETPDCRRCTWDWDTSAFLRSSGLIRMVFPRCHLLTSPHPQLAVPCIGQFADQNYRRH